MKIKVLMSLAVVSILASVAQANEPDFTCVGSQGANNPDQSVTVNPGKKLTVHTVMPVCAYSWYSEDSLQGTPVGIPDGNPGGSYVVEYVIDTSKQAEQEKTYTFEVAKSWDKGALAEPPVECKITVSLGE